MRMLTLSNRPSISGAFTRSKRWRLTASQFVGLIVLFAALSAGRTFVQAGWEKWSDPAWTGGQAGVALQGFLAGADFKATKTDMNPQSDVLPAVNDFNHGVVSHHAPLFGWLVVPGELLVPASVIALLCLRFPGSRAALIIIAALAAGLNLLYLHEGSAGLNPPMLLLWLTVLWTAVHSPAAAQAHAVDLGQLVRRASGRRPSVSATVPGQWFVGAALLIVLALESLLLYDAATVLVLIVATLGLAGALSCINRVVAAVSSRAANFYLSVSPNGSRIDVEAPGLNS